MKLEINFTTYQIEGKFTTYQNLGAASSSQVALRGTFIAINTYLEKQKNLNNLTFHCKKIGKEEQIKLTACRRKEIIEIGAEVKEIEKQYRR